MKHGSALWWILLAVTVVSSALAQDQAKPATAASITFRDIAAGDQAGITYRRGRSSTQAIFDALKTKAPYTFADLLSSPVKARGAPGVAIFDFDGDGDLDIYVTNGPGRANSLYSNQLRETGQLTFVDVAAAAGVDATDQDSTGVCYGDIDNDGDPDLLVLGRSEPNRLFENLGNGTFRDITAGSGLGDDRFAHASCAMGDINGDGLLDIVVANTFDWSSMRVVFAEPLEAFKDTQHNQLFLNRGAGRFADVSAASGIRNLAGVPAAAATISWAIALVDYDLDGDVDIIFADDQAATVRARYGGVDRGFIHILRNDGTGHFTDVTVDVGTNKAGQWMGLAFGDFNCDGHLDIFGTNGGDYFVTGLPPFPYSLGDDSSRWMLGRPDGTFADPGVGELIATPFGWGTSALDYDNDGDTDIIFHGGLSVHLIVESSNPGALLRNERCSARFIFDAAALAGTAHTRRNVEGVAVGDLNGDGFPDIVSVSSFDKPAPVPLVRYPVSLTYGSPFDPTAVFVPEFSPDPEHEGGFLWGGPLFDYPDGTLSVEINSGDNGNSWVEVRTLGTVGLTSGGRVNRDGIGAVVFFTPLHGKQVMRPVLGGSSYASQDSLTGTFGLGSAHTGTIEVLWPGGARNRLYDVHRSERIVFPEIPCSFHGDWGSLSAYRACVELALGDLTARGVLDEPMRARLLSSSLRAFSERNSR